MNIPLKIKDAEYAYKEAGISDPPLINTNNDFSDALILGIISIFEGFIKYENFR